jgi:lipopolysaccharide export LptBFGC system permease protein LptF
LSADTGDTTVARRGSDAETLTTIAQAIDALNALPGITAANADDNDGSGTIAATSGSFTPGASAEWVEPQVDFQGYPYEPPATILALIVHCTSGACHIEIDGAELEISAGQKIQIANQSGIFSTLDSIQLTNTTGATQVDVSVIASTI